MSEPIQASPSVDTEVAILGGGPAGLAAAIALRQQGIDCTVYDALIPPIDKGCGEGLMPDALESLAALGLHPTTAHGHPFHGIRFANATHSATARFPHQHALGIRRTVLHQLLAEQAAALGASLAWGSHVKLVDRNTLLVNGSPTRYRWLLGADGQTSTVRRWAGLDRETLGPQRIGLRLHYGIAPWADSVEVHWGPLGQAYVTPVSPGCVGVALLARQGTRTRGPQILASFPALAERLASAPLTSRSRGAVSTTRTLHRVNHGNVGLLGDAAGSVDSITGEGLALAFRQAVALAACIREGDLRPYQAAHRDIMRLPGRMSQLLLLMDRFPLLECRVLSVFDQNPQFFQQMLSVHLGAGSMPRFLLQHGPALGLKLVTTTA